MVLTHTCRTFLSLGAIQARRLPSGERRGETRSGLPKRVSRGMRGGSWANVAAAGPRVIAARTNARATVFKRLCMKESSFQESSIGGLYGWERRAFLQSRPHGHASGIRREVDRLEPEGGT